MAKILGEEFRGESCYDFEDRESILLQGPCARTIETGRLVEEAYRRDMLKLLNSPEAKGLLEWGERYEKEIAKDFREVPIEK